MILRLPLVLVSLALAACGQGDDTSSAGVTADEQRQLNEAAAATDINASINVSEEAK